METNKQFYIAPVAKSRPTMFERGFLALSNGVNYSDTPGGAGGDDNYNDGDDY